MYENRHFLSYRKRRHDAENYVRICPLRHSGESLQNGQQPQGNRLEKNPLRISRMKLRRHCQQLGLCLFPPCYFIFSRTLLGAWCFGLFRSVYSSFHNRLDHIREPAFYWVFLFYFPSLSVFVSSYVKMKKFCSFQFNRLAISWPPWVMVWGWAGSCH